MRILHAIAVASFLLCSCQAPTVAPSPVATDPPAERLDAKKDEGKAAEEKKQKEETRKQKQKELRAKQRELEYAKVEGRIADIDRHGRAMAAEASLQRTAGELDKSKSDLEVFLKELRPREIEERKISLDQSIYRAEHAKDELNELVAMYEADEFARTTKELVLKRGRRDLEMAERSLGIAKRESAHLEGYVLPQRERDLRQKVADAELERRKAEMEAEKVRIEAEVGVKKQADRVADLEEDVRDLQETLKKEQP